jgi:hypothetical protein
MASLLYRLGRLSVRGRRWVLGIWVTLLVGAVVAEFQWGWLDQLVGLDSTLPIVSFLPMMTGGVVAPGVVGPAAAEPRRRGRGSAASARSPHRARCQVPVGSTGGGRRHPAGARRRSASIHRELMPSLA